MLEAPVLTERIEANNEIAYSCCYQIKLKYEEVLLEFSSVKEIVKLLQEERIYNANTIVSNVNQGLEYDQLNIDCENWTQVPFSRNNRSSKIHRQYPQQKPTIINLFASLHNVLNLNDDAVNIMEDATEMNEKFHLSNQVNMT